MNNRSVAVFPECVLGGNTAETSQIRSQIRHLERNRRNRNITDAFPLTEAHWEPYWDGAIVNGILLLYKVKMSAGRKTIISKPKLYLNQQHFDSHL